MNIAVIFAGGTGQRMNSRTRPKQFLELHGKPIVVYTLEVFQQAESIDAIILVMLEKWIDYSAQLIEKYQLSKVKAIVPGGANGQESIFHGIEKAYKIYPKNSIVLIHDGVRPLIDVETINNCISCVEKNGNAITISPAIETVALMEQDGGINTILPRSQCKMLKAPQAFVLSQIYDCHIKAIKAGLLDFIDSASLMQYYGYQLSLVEGPMENIKITTPGDFYVFRAIEDAKENAQIFGV